MALERLSTEQLQRLLDLVRGNTVEVPPSGFALSRHGFEREANALATELSVFSQPALERTVAILLRERERTASEPARLVFSGPSTATTTPQSTRDVLEDMFNEASESVLLAGYSFSTHSHGIFETLSARMREKPNLVVQLILHVEKSQRHYAESPGDFLQRIWPRGGPIPNDIFTLVQPEGGERATMHAKCAVVDRKWVLVTSANFTARAQKRNVELGVKLQDVKLANAIHAQWQALVELGVLERHR